MTRRRNHDEEVKRLDWRDPDMPVLRPWEEPWGAVVIKAIKPEEEQDYRKEMLRFGNAPSWQYDGTYNLAKPGEPSNATKRAQREERKCRRIAARMQRA